MLIDYTFAMQVEPIPTNLMYRYVTCASGVFVQAKRENLEAAIQISRSMDEIRGLCNLSPYIKLPAKVPAGILRTILEVSRKRLPREILFYLIYAADGWRAIVPQQLTWTARCKPTDPYNPYAVQALIEIHSHNTMSAFFSKTDDNDETGFKIYAVLGRVDQSLAEIYMRVGIYGHFYTIPARWVFEPVKEIADVF